MSSTSNQFFICCFHHLIWYLKLSLFGAYETLTVDDEAWYWILCKCLILLGWFFKQYNYTLNTLWNFIQCGNVHCNHSYPVISSLMTEFMKSSSKLSQRGPIDSCSVILEEIKNEMHIFTHNKLLCICRSFYKKVLYIAYLPFLRIANQAWSKFMNELCFVVVPWK